LGWDSGFEIGGFQIGGQRFERAACEPAGRPKPTGQRPVVPMGCVAESQAAAVWWLWHGYSPRLCVPWGFWSFKPLNLFAISDFVVRIWRLTPCPRR